MVLLAYTILKQNLHNYNNNNNNNNTSQYKTGGSTYSISSLLKFNTKGMDTHNLQFFFVLILVKSASRPLVLIILHL